jgi:hypothetical protein
MGDQHIARTLSTHRITQIPKKDRTHIHALSGIRTHDPSIQTGLQTVHALDRATAVIMRRNCKSNHHKPESPYYISFRRGTF